MIGDSFVVTPFHYIPRRRRHSKMRGESAVMPRQKSGRCVIAWNKGPTVKIALFAECQKELKLFFPAARPMQTAFRVARAGCNEMFIRRHPHRNAPPAQTSDHTERPVITADDNGAGAVPRVVRPDSLFLREQEMVRRAGRSSESRLTHR